MKNARLLFINIFLVFCLFNAAAFAQETADSTQTIPDTLLFKLEKSQSVITEINAANKRGFNIDVLQRRLTEIENAVNPVKQDLEKSNSKAIENKTLQSYSLILKDAQLKLTNLRNTLSKSNNELQRLADEVVKFSNDTVLSTNPKDTTGKKFYNQQLSNIKLKLHQAGKLTTSNLDSVGRLLADVSAISLTVTDLETQINEQLAKSGKNSFKKESPYLWAAPQKNTLGENIGELLRSSYRGQNKILTYFINSTWDTRILLLLLGCFFFYWAHKNYKEASSPKLKQKIGELDFEYLSLYPVLASFVLILQITPIFELDSPALYIELIQFLTFIVLTIYFRKKLRTKKFNYWLTFAGLYLVLVFTNAIITDALFSRLLLIALNIAFVYVAIKARPHLRENFTNRKFNIVLFIFFAFHALSILLNIFGRISLSKILSTTATIGLAHFISLAIFIKILTETLELKIKVSSCSDGLFSRLNPGNTRSTFKKLFRFIATVLWLIVFSVNLNIINGLVKLFTHVFNKPRTFGSISFTLTNILFFIIIFYISNTLQKHVAILFGDKQTEFNNNDAHKSSKIALLRLVIIVVGVLFAFTASGIPMDKLTVVLGALSVGIGLGMQNIVNNFVSGVILIFEKPFRIGDYIELADKKGKIKDIGIRSSKMITEEGSEVIIPNGDLLSGRLVNWTLSNDYVKSAILLKVGIGTDLELVNKIIKEEAGGINYILKRREPEILVINLTAETIELKITNWISSIYSEADFKNQFFRKLLLRFKKEDIKIM